MARQTRDQRGKTMSGYKHWQKMKTSHKISMKSTRLHWLHSALALATASLLPGCASPKNNNHYNSHSIYKNAQCEKRVNKVRYIPPPNIRSAGTTFIPMGAVVIPNRELRKKYGPLPQGTISVPGKKRGKPKNKK